MMAKEWNDHRGTQLFIFSLPPLSLMGR